MAEPQSPFAITVKRAWFDAHPDAAWVLKTFGSEAGGAQGFEECAALIRLMLPPECVAGECAHRG